MAFAKRFEDLEVWKEACRFVKAIYEVTNSSRWARDRDLISQMRRAAISIPSNISEGFEKGSSRDFARYLLMARGSAGEIRTQIYIARSLDYLNRDQFNTLREQVIHISSMLTKLIQSLKAKP
jgi:four helix bundle protein